VALFPEQSMPGGIYPLVVFMIHVFRVGCGTYLRWSVPVSVEDIKTIKMAARMFYSVWIIQPKEHPVYIVDHKKSCIKSCINHLR